ncbi:sodium-coupled monocarboxylate transporter 2-like [Strongylocentrotus purpuratus]|uniref:Sodium-coupled monocarboxylate transporter 1 n=1 Tax=Strongylocentrotus purpuratus TaxID=7668 RepID=A0A7M7NN59_STRPU|nr:sodium-coupled monocarboxylate transporter 2-like [Strongylocentrotus purpuratus]
MTDAEFYDVGLFQAWDYVVLGAMLSVSAGIGVFYAFTGGRQSTAREFLLANRNMNPIPVAMSLVASFISAITVLGTPAEMYLNGPMYWLYGIAFIFTGLLTSLFLPTFYRLGVTSANEYLEKRFNKPTRLLGTTLYILQMNLYLGIVIYAPALALNQVSGLNLWGSVLAIGIVCTFYTTIGGMKAVLWTDTFQVTVMMAGFLAVIIAGSMNVDGFNEAWRIAGEGGRLDILDFNPDPTVRHTFWTVVIGGTFYWSTVYAVNQSQVQRYLTCRSEKTALLSLFMAIIGMIIVVSAACISGIVMYANFADCDPITMGYVSKSDQLMPYFVMYLFGKMPGLPGLFTSAIFSAALSTVSSGVNSLAAVVGEDIVKSIWPDIKDKTYTWTTKGLALFFGILTIAMAFVSSQLGSILGAAFSVVGMIGGPLLGLYTSGMFFPWINSKGVFVGTLLGLTWSLWVGIGAQIYPPSSEKPPLSIAGCNITLETITTLSDTLMTSSTMEPPMARPAIASLYSLSYAWYSGAAMLMTVFWALIFSFLTGANDPRTLNPMLISPIADRMYCCLPEYVKRHLRCGVGDLYEEGQYEKVAGKEMQVAKSNPDYVGQSSTSYVGNAPNNQEEPHTSMGAHI